MDENRLVALNANKYSPIKNGIYETKIPDTNCFTLVIVDATPTDGSIDASISTALVDDKSRNVRAESIEIAGGEVTMTIDGPVVRIGNYTIIDDVYDPVTSCGNDVANMPIFTLYGLKEIIKNRGNIPEGQKNTLSRIEQIISQHSKKSLGR